jgi:hypothetical protein
MSEYDIKNQARVSRTWARRRARWAAWRKTQARQWPAWYRDIEADFKSRERNAGVERE